MKYLLLAGVTALLSSSAWADEPAPVAPDSAPAEAALEIAPVVAAPQGDFCGQEMVQAWMWQTDIGRELRLKQQVAIKQVVAQAEAARTPAIAPQDAPAAEPEAVPESGAK